MRATNKNHDALIKRIDEYLQAAVGALEALYILRDCRAALSQSEPVRYVPMTDDELQDVWIKSGDLNGTETMRMMESAVIRRAGLWVVCEQTENQE